MALIGGLTLTLVAILPHVLEMSGVPTAFSFGGTSSIIAIAVAIDIWENIKARTLSERTKKDQMRKITESITQKEYRGKAIFA